MLIDVVEFLIDRLMQGAGHAGTQQDVAIGDELTHLLIAE